jgi:1,4-dihydroxy-2-naphthoate octaprenyltransferase|tara:strand:+ start:1099 stop:1998 length:900 start_codon:yes stop_codon:yes gene_type:complete
MNKLKIWLEAFRLRTLPLSLSGIILGSFIALHDGFWNTGVFIFSLLTTLFFQILSNLSNDLGDHLKGTDNENRIGPMRSTQSGAISAKQMTNAVRIFVLLSFISAGVLIYIASKTLTVQAIWIYVGLGIASVLAALLYTLGKKAYGYHGLGDIFVFIFFGLVSVLGVYGLYSSSFSWANVPVACGIGLLSTAVLNLNNLRDHENDEVAGKRTMVVKLGFKNGKTYHFALILIAATCLSYFFILQSGGLSAIALILFVPLIFHVKRVKEVENPGDLDGELKKVALSTFFIAIAASILMNL